MNYQEITKCRLSGKKDLVPILSLGSQCLTGVFPRKKDKNLTSAPLELVWSPSSQLVQLKHSCDAAEMYGENYGYRSGLNPSMVAHLTSKARRLEKNAQLKNGDCVLDIGSSDGTLLCAYKGKNLFRIGIDPSAKDCKPIYQRKGMHLVPEFFSSKIFKAFFPHKKPRLITSVAMFYDLENPRRFVEEVHEVLEDGGFWHLEQSYLPTMLRQNSYDTICHEHLEYYSFGPVYQLLKECGFEVLDVLMNSVNGGSFSITACKRPNSSKKENPVVQWLLSDEKMMNLPSLKPFEGFRQRIERHRESLHDLIISLKKSGKKILGYGASTKGNVILQYCKLGRSEISAIVDVNPAKEGCVTPGTWIPIISEKEGRKIRPDYFLVLPWHFRDFIVRKESEFLLDGGKMIFPLPEIEIVSSG